MGFEQGREHLSSGQSIYMGSWELVSQFALIGYVHTSVSLAAFFRRSYPRQAVGYMLFL